MWRESKIQNCPRARISSFITIITFLSYFIKKFFLGDKEGALTFKINENINMGIPLEVDVSTALSSY